MQLHTRVSQANYLHNYDIRTKDRRKWKPTENIIVIKWRWPATQKDRGKSIHPSCPWQAEIPSYFLQQLSHIKGSTLRIPVIKI